ncbi:hypothetical protein K435DRAFT_792182 [Dendrothele bispora CBS 962.96]|uniref:Uncharacterized protein n=1 Tax=Dendrothele bispora (strain CBS 962.96) TaxID=1314807 RepID=A0A4S8MJJ6_DENBC|nr:hypothetical protein K435DRAFT_792182 [Dendrothele bispora CBS 962.96]
MNVPGMTFYQFHSSHANDDVDIVEDMKLTILLELVLQDTTLQRLCQTSTDVTDIELLSKHGTAYPSEGIPTKTVSDVAVQTDATTFPVDISSAPYEKLSNRFAKAKSKCNDLHLRRLRKLISESNKEMTEARKLIGESHKELIEAREELDDAIYVKECAVSDARFWRGKRADMGGVPDVADRYDNDYT